MLEKVLKRFQKTVVQPAPGDPRHYISGLRNSAALAERKRKYDHKTIVHPDPEEVSPTAGESPCIKPRSNSTTGGNSRTISTKDTGFRPNAGHLLQADDIHVPKAMTTYQFGKGNSQKSKYGSRWSSKKCVLNILTAKKKENMETN